MWNRNRLAPAVAILAVLLALVVGCQEDKKLKVTGIEPASGAFEGGTRVIIKGNRFTKDGMRKASVFFGDRKGDVLSFRGDGELIVKTPGGAPNEKVDVLIIFEPGGEITLKQAFTYIEEKKLEAGDLDIRRGRQ
jgi:hypothetical protein